MEFEDLVKQFQPMVKQFVRKYKGVCEQYLIDTDEIEQICLIALWKAQEKHDPQGPASFSTYAYNQMDYAIRTKLSRIKPIYKESISLQLLASNDDDTTTLQDTLEANIDVYSTVEDKLMMIFYKNEIRTKLDEDNAEILISKYFEGCCGIPHKEVTKARKKLLQKSYIFKQEYRKIKGIDTYKSIMI